MVQRIHFHNRLSAVKPLPASPLVRTEPPGKRPSDWRQEAYIAALAITLLIALVEIARAGGPQYVAGTAYFNEGLAGQPVTWPNGAITYYTDLGSLSPILPGADADALVAGAFSRWTAIWTAAVSATRAGQLAEDVSGTNVILNADRTISMPIAIQPSAIPSPLRLSTMWTGWSRMP
jgi:hypothetical protein